MIKYEFYNNNIDNLIWIPEGTTHVGPIKPIEIPCFGFKANLDLYKVLDDKVYVYRTDSDNEYGQWWNVEDYYRKDRDIVLKLYSVKKNDDS